MQTELYKHPKSLRVFFSTEMWERYGFYVVQSLLALYLALHFKWQDQAIYALVGSFTAVTYLSPVIGGWVADHLLGQKRAILLGALILFFSYLSLSFNGQATMLPLALAGIAVGTGLLKPNISSLLGNEYPSGSAKRESGFTIFYMGITMGIILGTTVPSILNHYFGWSTCFGSAALGMIMACFIFTLGVKYYKIRDYHPYQFKWANLGKTACILTLLWLMAFFVLAKPMFANTAFALVVILSLGYLLYTIHHEPPLQAKQTAIIGLLCIISMMFWPFYFQMFLSWTLFISRAVEPTLWGFDFPAPYYVSVQSLGMLFFGYLFSRNKAKAKVNLKQTNQRTANKFLLSMLFITIAYGLVALITQTSVNNNYLSPFYFIPAYLMISIAELLLSPVGLSAITVLASRKRVSTMMGIFFVSLGIGAFLSGKLASLTSLNVEIEHLSIAELKAHYAASFTELFYILLVVLILCVALNKLINHLLGGAKP